VFVTTVHSLYTWVLCLCAGGSPSETQHIWHLWMDYQLWTHDSSERRL